MKVIYLKNTHDAKVGDVRVLKDFEANALITLKVVKKYKENTDNSKQVEKSEKVEKIIKRNSKKAKE